MTTQTQHQIRVRLTLPADLHRRLAAMPSGLRSQLVSSILIGNADGVDLTQVIASIHEIRRAAVLLNQCLKAYWSSDPDQRPSVDADKIEDVVRTVQRLTYGVRA